MNWVIFFCLNSKCYVEMENLLANDVSLFARSFKKQHHIINMLPGKPILGFHCHAIKY